MIGRVVLSDRNIYKIKSGTKQVSARKCNILSCTYANTSPNILIKTSKEFCPHDEYIKFDPETNTILEGLGQVGLDSADLDIYYHLFTNGWMSLSKYTKLWEEYINLNYDLATIVGIERVEYLNQVITIDPTGSVDLDDGFSFRSSELFYYLDIHIADPVSWFDLTEPKFIQIFNELNKRLQTCYISKYSNPTYPTHLLPPNIVNIVSLLDPSKNSKINSRRALSFCFKISKKSKQIEEFELKPTCIKNISNYSYDDYDTYINSAFNIKTKNNLVELTNILIEIIGLNVQTYSKLSCDDDISHKMIEIFMILTNWYGGNYLLNKTKSNPILRTQDSNQLSKDGIGFDINLVPVYARVFLSISANYIQADLKTELTEYTHYSLGISNYAHLSSPMRRFIDMINHLKFYYSLGPINNVPVQLCNYDLIQINAQIKMQKKISNAWNLIKFLKSNPESNQFRACLFDWVEDKKNNNVNNIYGLLVLYHKENNFISIVNVELPQIESTNKLVKYMEWDIKLYYNSNKFNTPKFPFSIKII